MPRPTSWNLRSNNPNQKIPRTLRSFPHPPATSVDTRSSSLFAPGFFSPHVPPPATSGAGTTSLSLKAIHLAFIDEYSEGTGKTWDDQKLTARIAAVEKQFSDAEQYEATKKGDARRSKAISILHSQFRRHAGMLQTRKAFYRTKFAANLKDQVTQNSDQALRGEDLRQ
jgi:hypothetical protein